jgi:hypothetical protein
VLAGYPKPRRLKLVISLWEDVCALHEQRQRVIRRNRSQVHPDRVGKLRERCRDHYDNQILYRLTWQIGSRSQTLAAAARWRPPDWWTGWELRWLLHDAIAATALLRFARTLSDEGLAVAADRHHAELVAAAACLTEEERSKAAARGEGAYSHPARPGVYVHRLARTLGPDRTVTAKTEARVKDIAAMARNYGTVVFEAADALLSFVDRPLHDQDPDRPWQAPHLSRWRAAVGHFRAPQTWEQRPLPDAHADGPEEPLARRIAEADPAQVDPAQVETPHDLLWFADLADALAPFHGNESATVRHVQRLPLLAYVAPPPQELDHRQADSVPLAAARVAQLVMFGATPPPRCGSWAELVAGVNAAAVVAEASTGVFPIPPGVSDVDRSSLAGLTVELGREPSQLAEWSGYMGNCIGQSWYADEARKGQCVLMALRDPTDGRMVANLDVRRHTGGWHVHELLGRFNDNVEDELEQQVKRWVERLPVPAPFTPEPLPPAPPARARGGSARRSAAARLPAELIRALTTAVEQELAATRAVSARRTYAALARGLGKAGPADFEPDAAVIALKRAGRHVDLVRAALDDGLSATVLWQATRVRPLTTAVNRLDPALREYDRLRTLTDGSPLPRTLRALVRRPEVTPAYAMDVVARTVRTAVGRLVHDDVLIRSVARRPSIELVCALTIAVTIESTKDVVRVAGPEKTTVPGFPASDLADPRGPWQQAMPAAADLGAPVDRFWPSVAEHGLLVPAALLGKGGWPALWSRLHR